MDLTLYFDIYSCKRYGISGPRSHSENTEWNSESGIHVTRLTDAQNGQTVYQFRGEEVIPRTSRNACSSRLNPKSTVQVLRIASIGQNAMAPERLDGMRLGT